MIKKIAVIGPESTGKSTLCRHLADHYGTEWVPEYAREYLLKHGIDYTYDDLLTIAMGQVNLEDQYFERMRSRISTFPPSAITHGANYLFIDTEMFVMKVWCEFVFGKCHPWILDQVATRKYDLYLLCNIDLPWTPDILREYPDPEPRNELFRIYKNLMDSGNTPWAVISGSDEERLAEAVRVVGTTFRK